MVFFCTNNLGRNCEGVSSRERRQTGTMPYPTLTILSLIVVFASTVAAVLLLIASVLLARTTLTPDEIDDVYAQLWSIPFV